MSRVLTITIVVLIAVSGCSRQRESPPPPNPGAIPATSDQDGDGILDSWETDGLDYTDPSDGSSQHLDLKALGFSPRHKDILLWVAWMETGATHSHRPPQDSIDAVRAAFRRAPVNNPDNVPGIELHVVPARQPVAEVAMLGNGSIDPFDWSAFDAIKKSRLPTVLNGTAFFALFAHDISNRHYSGLARSIPGRDFIVSLGAFTQNVGTKAENAGTLMHELGHTLGLRHGGIDDVQYKPNYVSVMNYLFQLNGLTISGIPGNFDYSRFRLDLTEQSLNETRGLDGMAAFAKYGTLFSCCSTCASRGRSVFAESVAASRVDWNCDSQFMTMIATDVNADNTRSPLAGASDWDHVVFKEPPQAGQTPANVAGSGPELTAIEADRVPLLPVVGVRARRIGNGVLVEWEGIPLDRVVAYRVYRSAGADTPQLVATVENVSQPSFADISTVVPGSSYSVTAVFLPHQAMPDAPADAGLAPPPPSGAGRPASEAWITASGAVNAVREAAPNAMADVLSLGNASQAGVAAETPPPLRETNRSQEARVP